MALSISLRKPNPSIISFLIQAQIDGDELEGANYFRFFTLLCVATSVIYVYVSRHYKERTYLQSQEPHPEEPILAAGAPA